MSHGSRLRSFEVPLCHKHHDHGDHSGPGHEHARDAGARHDPPRGVGPHGEHGDAHGSVSPHSHDSAASGTAPIPTHLRPILTEPLRATLKRGAAQGKLVYFDAQSGAAGDMTVAALLDLGVPFEVVSDAVAALGLEGVTVSAKRVFVGAIAATLFDVHVEGPQIERTYAAIVRLLDGAALDAEAKDSAQRVFARLARAEGRVHGISPEEVHFHEVGAADSIVDIVGACAALAHLGGRAVWSPLPLGHGHVHCRHGIIPIPAPATVLCLENMATYDGGVQAELVTPTGAALAGTLASECRRWPPMRTVATGWGAGHRPLPDRPNALRVVLGEPDGAASEGIKANEAATHELIECNVDDMTGELVGHAIVRLLDEGALDAWAAPIVMKKGRAAWTLSALCRAEDALRLSDVLLAESTSLGLRRTPVSRVELERRVMTVKTRFGDVPVKVATNPGQRGFKYKPEFDVCAELAKAHRVSVQRVVSAALRQIQTEEDDLGA